MRFKKGIFVLLAVFCLSGISCSSLDTKYKPVYKYTDDNGKEIYDWPAGSETGMIDVHGGKVAYRIYGKDKPGVPIIFVHGGPGGTYNYLYKQLCLAEDRPVVLYDQLGSCLSEISPEFQTEEKVKTLFTIDRYCDELNSVVNYFNFKNFVLGGYSWGCMLELEYAAKYNPSGLKGIVFIGPFLNVDTWLKDAERLIKSLDGGDEMWQEVVQCESSHNYTDRYNQINEIYSQNFTDRHKQDSFDKPNMNNEDVFSPKIAGVDVYDYMWGNSEFVCTGTLQHHDSTPLLNKIKVPVLYISGQYDSGTPQAAFDYCSKTPNGEVAVIPGAAHHTYMERPNEFNVILTEYLKRIEGAQNHE
ncbi:MAG: proline iminopeptidase-family hydrolase [Coriobacteriia bacterium]|nr:proline iminopeptidase-family hydrolase [Coriobacteriia bacterium]